MNIGINRLKNGYRLTPWPEKPECGKGLFHRCATWLMQVGVHLSTKGSVSYMKDSKAEGERWLHSRRMEWFKENEDKLKDCSADARILMNEGEGIKLSELKKDRVFQMLKTLSLSESVEIEKLSPNIFDYLNGLLMGIEKEERYIKAFELIPQLKRFQNFKKAWKYLNESDDEKCRFYYTNFIKENGFNPLNFSDTLLSPIELKKFHSKPKATIEYLLAPITTLRDWLDKKEGTQGSWLPIRDYLDKICPKIIYNIFTYLFSSLMLEYLANVPNDIIPNNRKLAVSVVVAHFLATGVLGIEFSMKYLYTEGTGAFSKLYQRNVTKLTDAVVSGKWKDVVQEGVLNATGLFISNGMSQVLPEKLIKRELGALNGAIKRILRTLYQGTYGVRYDKKKLWNYIVIAMAQGFLMCAIKSGAKNIFSGQQEAYYTALMTKDLLDPFLKFGFVQSILVLMFLTFNFSAE